MVIFVTKKKEGYPSNMFEMFLATFLVIILLKFVSNIRYTVKKSIKQNKLIVIIFVKDFGMS